MRPATQSGDRRAGRNRLALRIDEASAPDPGLSGDGGLASRPRRRL